MKIFIDGLRLLRIESQAYIHQIHIDGYEINWVKNEGSNQYFQTSRPLDLHLHDTIEVNHETYLLEIGLVTLTSEFETKYRYDGELGCIYTPKQSTFRVFSPVAKEIFVVIDDIPYPMNYEEPIWTKTLEGDLEGKSYHYHVRLTHIFHDVNDPYAKAMADGKAYIINDKKLNRINPSPIKLKQYVDAVIYEGHVRDLSINLDVPSKGLFSGLIEPSRVLKGSVLQYIKRLGMTHLQLLPIFDFEGVDDHHKDVLYNWGYNPSYFMSIEGWFSKDPSNPYERMNEVIDLVNEAHRLKLGITMDVVFNHVYQNHTFPYDYLVPGYFYRHNAAKKMTDASFCGNDIETRNYMVRKLITDTLVYFAKNFQIDGFRFDLMGLMDIETMKTIEMELRKINPNIMLYGEGWNMANEVMSKQRANMHNQGQFPTYAHFNDLYRNTMKGELHGSGLGFAMGNRALIPKAMEVIKGSPTLFSSPNQSINYVECHDNLTFYDKLLLSSGFEKEKYKLYQDFANHLIAISIGIPFYHAGQETYRSKMGVENSYRSPDLINGIHYHPKDIAVTKLKKILKIRRKYRHYHQTSYTPNVEIVRDQNLIIYTLTNHQTKLIHYIKSERGIGKFPLHGGELIFSSQDVYLEEDTVIADEMGIYLVKIKIAKE